jgi:hypothetical protein
MPSRYICEIHDDIDEAVKKLRIDLIPGLCEEARVAGKRMEAKLNDYAGMKYEIRRYKELKKAVAQLRTTKEFLESQLDLDEVPDSDEEDSWPEDL